MIFLDATELARLLPPDSLRERMRDALALSAGGRAASSPRHVLPLEGGALGAMLGAGGGYLGGKLVCVLPGNRRAGLNPHQGIAALFDPENGRCLCIGDASALTALRTAAASAAATEALARHDAAVLTIVGSGEQAYQHGVAMLAVRPIREMRIVARNGESAEKMAAKFRDRIEVNLLTDPLNALAGSDILCLCTSAVEPYLRASSLPLGIHVNAIGACRPGAREIDLDEGMVRIFVDSLDSAKEEAEELRARFARREMPIEVGAVFGGAAGRLTRDDITLFKSVGIGIEDTAALSLAFERKREQHP